MTKNIKHIVGGNYVLSKLTSQDTFDILVKDADEAVRKFLEDGSLIDAPTLLGGDEANVMFWIKNSIKAKEYIVNNGLDDKIPLVKTLVHLSIIAHKIGMKAADDTRWAEFVKDEQGDPPNELTRTALKALTVYANMLDGIAIGISMFHKKLKELEAEAAEAAKLFGEDKDEPGETDN